MEAVIFLIILAVVLLAMRPKDLPKVEKKADCPPHKWTYNHKDQMQCTVCNALAGHFKTENGEYDES